ncbi:MAG: sigma-54 dependent transcriptional regulator [Bacteroidales bacterium]|nr:sigma-54 dependent transcriptional regulator [Bacteroidales bacterium]MCF6341507.1 sigma-54 dependent transcriptional regulator [Bacteroidales bacterium]
MNKLRSVAIITQDEQMLRLIDRINKIADSDSSVLLIGETGVGKEVFADYIHHLSNRGPNPFVKIGLAALPPELLESELFGFEKGSFTNADHQKKGMFELAHTGSILLDDIDDTPLKTQVKLLRVLETNEVRHIGGTQAIPVDVRLICASKVEIKDMVEHKLFRQDLYYRINIVQIRIPPLRERKEDIPLLIGHFLKRFGKEKKLGISKTALDHLMGYHWPGNVRELRNVIQRASLFAENDIKVSDLPDDYLQIDPIERLMKACHSCFTNSGMPFHSVMQCLETRLLKEALEHSKGNQSEAARRLGMKLSTFRDKIKKADDCQPETPMT